MTYLNFFEINSILFKEVHEIAEVLCAWFVVTTIGPDGLHQKKREHIRTMQPTRKYMTRSNQSIHYPDYRTMKDIHNMLLKDKRNDKMMKEPINLQLPDQVDIIFMCIRHI
jgi:hypothetical protein